MKKLTLIFAALLAACPAFASVDIGAKTSSTPYDPYLSPVKHVLAQLDGKEESVDHVRQLMRIGRGFRYSYTTPYTAASPEVTAATRAGDCKAKALWLAAQLNDSTVQFVIGKARASSRLSHAWLLWTQDSSHTWILDCTNCTDPILAQREDTTREYIPTYSYSKHGSYRYGARYASNEHRKAVAQSERRLSVASQARADNAS